MSEQTPPKTPRRRKVNVWANDESETPNKGFNAALDLVREQQSQTTAAPQERREEVPERGQQPASEEEEEDTKFEETYKHTTYYIKRTNEPRLKRLAKKFKRGPQRKTKYELMEEALEYLFEKYGIE